MRALRGDDTHIMSFEGIRSKLFMEERRSFKGHYTFLLIRDQIDMIVLRFRLEVEVWDDSRIVTFFIYGLEHSGYLFES